MPGSSAGTMLKGRAHAAPTSGSGGDDALQDPLVGGGAGGGVTGDGGTGTGDPPKGPKLTIAGVEVSATASGATFSAIEEALGVDWARSARDAAKLGGSAVLKLLAPHLPAGTQQMKVARDLADAYAAWAAGQPPPTDAGLGKAEQFTFDAGEHGGMAMLEEAIGLDIGGFAPVAGRSVTAKGSGSVSVEGVFLSLSLKVEAARTKDAFEVGGEAQIGIGLGTAEESISIRETLGVKGSGDDAVEAMHMAGLAIEKWMRNQQFDWTAPSWEEAVRAAGRFWVNEVALSTAGGPVGTTGAVALLLAGGKIADALWGGKFEDDIVKNMDDDDYGSYTMGVGGELKADSPDAERRGSLDYTHTDKVTNVNGAVGTTGEDDITARAKLEVDVGAFKVGISGKIELPLSMDNMTMGFEIAVSRKKSALSGADRIAPIAANLVRGLGAAAAKRAGGWVEEVANAVDTFMGLQAVGGALLGVGEAKVEASYDHNKGQLSLKLVVVQSIDEKGGNAEGAVKVSFEVGQEVLARTFDVGRP